MLYNTVFNTSQICQQYGVKHAVLSPGSRNAPLTISFARNNNIRKWIIPDERSAGFIALGIAQETKTPVVLCCTSGTALLNYAPAIAEAFYREIPLIVLSADRPPELIDQRDGQTIRQYEALRNHVKLSEQLPIVTSKKDSAFFQKLLIESIICSIQVPKGPVHLNIPFREPFYPAEEDHLEFIDIEPIKRNIPNTSEEFKLPNVNKILVLLGQSEPDYDLQELVKEISSKIPVIRSPLNNLENGIEFVDGFIKNQPDLVPDLLITSGLSVLSKNLKKFIRSSKPNIHIHFDEAGVHVDTYQSNPVYVKASLIDCLGKLKEQKIDSSYLNRWKQLEEKADNSIEQFFKESSNSEAWYTYQVLKRIPSQSILHLSNSMPVRYADLFGIPKNIVCRSNRGTSGIDGCTSTAIGNSLISSRINFLITGDLAFLYDRNAFFHNYRLPNLKIIIMNNQGGGIFSLIDGPSKLPELEEYFETRHNRSAKYICTENSLSYYPIKSESDFIHDWEDFVNNTENTAVMEIFSDPDTNKRIYKDLRAYINEQIN